MDIKNVINLWVCLLVYLMSACAYKSAIQDYSAELTQLHSLKQINWAWLGNGNPNNSVVTEKLKWPILSAELNYFFEGNKPQIGLSKENTKQSLFDKIEIKDNVNLFGLDITMYQVLSKAPKIWQKYGKKVVITSGLEGKHCKNSRHYLGMALDLRSRDFKKKNLFKISKELNNALGNDYQVLLESDHFHVEYDPAIQLVGL